MYEKIQWYEEVMAQDPGSNLFLPLARLYAENAETEKAIRTLQNGLHKHPWHLEAKLLLNDLLYRVDRSEEALESSRDIFVILKDHPHFWLSFGDHFEHNRQQDLALAARMLGLAFSGRSPSLSDLCNQGLKQQLSEALSPETSAAPQGPWPSMPRTGTISTPEQAEQEASPAAVQSSVSLDYESRSLSQEEAPAQEEPPREPSTATEVYQTKTMAEILTAQGDYPEARGIYEHLLHKTDSDQDRTELQNRLQEIRELQTEQASETAESEQGGEEASNKQQLISQLEKLASRLEQL